MMKKMVLEYSYIRMVINIKVNSKKQKKAEKESITISTVTDMKASGNPILEVAKEFLI